MSVLSVLAYGADAAVLATYWHLARTGSARPFHWANAIGCVPLIILEVQAHLYQPLILTASFGALGALGIWKDRNGTHRNPQA